MMTIEVPHGYVLGALPRCYELAGNKIIEFNYDIL
jgi:hypothetical protein